MIQDIELRWVERQERSSEGTYLFTGRVLQWRKLVHNDYWNSAEWTSWQDVPLVEE